MLIITGLCISKMDLFCFLKIHETLLQKDTSNDETKEKLKKLTKSNRVCFFRKAKNTNWEIALYAIHAPDDSVPNKRLPLTTATLSEVYVI